MRFLPAPDESIWIGVLRLVLVVPGARSLKDKRRDVARVRDRLRARHNLSVAEVGHLDSPDRAVLAATLVSNDAVGLRSVLDRLAHEVESWMPAQIAQRSVMIFRPGPTEDIGAGGGGWL